MKRFFHLLILAAWFLPLPAQINDTNTQNETQLISDPAFAQSILWEIHREDLAQPSFLFGTIHMIGEKDFFFPRGTKDAFESCEVLALEIDMDNMGEILKLTLGGTMGGKSLQKLLDSADYARVKSFFIDTLDIGETEFAIANRMKPMLATSLLYPKMIEGEMVAYEDRFMKEAKKREMKVVGLEKVSDQLDAIDAIPLDEQLDMLLTYVDSFDAQVALFRELVNIYQQQDLIQLGELMSEAEDIGEYEDALLGNRNEMWIPIIEEMVAEQPTFIAVGAGHLWGNKGVIQLLRQEGYTVRAIRPLN